MEAPRRSTDEIRASEERYRALVEIASDWVWEMGPDLRFSYISERITEVADVDPAALVGRGRDEVANEPSEAEALADHLHTLRAHLPFDGFRYRRRRLDGRVQWFETSGRPLFDDAGNFLGYRGTAREVTREVEALERLRESEHRFRNLVEGSLQGMVVHRNLRPLFVNQAFVEMLGYESAAQVLALGSMQPLFTPQELARVSELNRRRLAGESPPGVYELEMLRADGSPVRLLNHARVVVWDGLDAVQATLVDVTERHRALEQLRTEKEFIERAIDSLPGIFYVIDVEGRFVRWNRHMETVSGYEGDEISRMSLLDFFAGDDRQHIGERIAEVFEHGEASAEAAFVPRNGRAQPYYFTGRRFVLSGRPCLVGMGIDVGERKQALDALRASEARFRALYDENPSMLFTLDREGVLRSINAFGAEQLGYEVDELVGRPATELYAEESRDDFRRLLEACTEAPGAASRWELPKRRRDGSTLHARETARLVRDPAGEEQVLVVAEDISETRDLSDRLAWQASHDDLTGLVNRREFEKRLARALETARRDDAEHGLLYLDLDQFKIVNDTCGHAAGDQLLRQVAAQLSGCLRRGDTLARLGGDEFAVLAPQYPQQDVAALAEKMRTALEELRFAWRDYSFKVAASIGVVPLDADAASVGELLSNADSACYVAKEQGRNRVHLHHPDDDAVRLRSGQMHWLGRLDAALEGNRFRLVRQSIVPLQGEETGAHFEVLLRALDDEGELASAGAYMSAAERFDVMGRVDRWVVAEALRALAVGGEPVRLCSINLSGQSITDEGFLQRLTQTIRDSGVAPRTLCFEITETAAISNLLRARRFVDALREMGCRFALDDFGSGLSSFAYLKTLPVDFIKIDGAFVKDVADDPSDLAVVRAINEMGHATGKRTIAEFVESEAILRCLREIGVDYAQGYHLGRPVPL